MRKTFRARMSIKTWLNFQCKALSRWPQTHIFNDWQIWGLFPQQYFFHHDFLHFMLVDYELLKGRFVSRETRVCVYVYVGFMAYFCQPNLLLKCILISGNAVNNVNFLCAVKNIPTLSSHMYTIIDWLRLIFFFCKINDR